MSKIFVFRHTETLDNRNHIFSGHRDVSITEEGKLAAKQIAGKLRGENVSYAFTSTLKRTVESMDIVLENYPECINCLEPRLDERSYGWLEGQSKDKWAMRSYRLFKLFHRSMYVPPPGGESLSMVRNKVLDFMKDLETMAKKYQQNVAICAHGNSIRGIREHFEKFDKKQFNKIETKVGELFVYEI